MAERDFLGVGWQFPIGVAPGPDCVAVSYTHLKLPAIAAKVYGDPRLWRPIADANAIDNPLRFPRQSDLGRLIVVPGQQP